MEVNVMEMDGTELHALMIMSSVKRLISHGYRPDGGGGGDDALGDRVNDLVASRYEDVKEKCISDLMMLYGNGADEESIVASARATFALAGIEIADQVHRDITSLN